LFAAYFLEAGLILIVAPWSAFWDRNSLAAAIPQLQSLAASPYARGAVSGLGLVTLLAGVADLGAAFASRRDTPNVPSQPTLSSRQ
jgi:hypothetical protein